jgi:acyl carrier protein
MSESVLLKEFVGAIAIILEISPSELLEARLGELESFDSLGLIQIAITIEDFFGLKVSSDELLGFENITEMYQSVATRALPRGENDQ